MKEIKSQDKIRIWMTFDRCFDVDMYDFRYKFTTGRMWTDKNIVLDVFYSRIDKVVESLFDYLNSWQKSAQGESVESLRKKGWINRWTLSKAKKIYEYYKPYERRY